MSAAGMSGVFNGPYDNLLPVDNHQPVNKKQKQK